MGTVAVVRERDCPDGPLLALKRLRAELRDDDEVRTMFLDESRVAALVRDPNVARVVEVGEDDAGPYIVMEYIDGVSVATWIEQHRASGTDVPLDACIEILRQSACGLAAAHDARAPGGEPLELVHRDVSPQNIIVGFDGVVRVVDFGIAKARGRQSRTSTGLLKGKAGYMAPEQLRFEPADARSDLFALGVVAYELATCERLYGPGLDDGSARRALDEPPPDLAEVRPSAPPAVVELMFELLAKDPEHRPGHAADVATRLAAIGDEQWGDLDGPEELAAYMHEHFEPRRLRAEDLVGHPDEATRAVTPPTEPAARPSARRLGLGIAGAVLLLGGVMWAWPSGMAVLPPAPEPRADATEPRVILRDFSPQWVTPSSIRWSWMPIGELDTLLRYEVRLAEDRDALLRGGAGVRVVGPDHNPELAYATLPNTKAGDLVVATTTDGLSPGTEYHAQLWAIDSRGTTGRSEIVAARTPVPPNRALPLYADGGGIGPGWPSVHPECLEEASANPHGGDAHFRYRAACEADGTASCHPRAPGTTTGCWENLVWSDGELELGKFTPGMFRSAYFEVAIALDDSLPSFWSEVRLRTPSGRWTVSALTLRADGGYHRYQIPLPAFTDQGRPLALEDMSSVGGFEIGGSWTAGGTVRVDEAILRY